jgi:hypothetical protein
MQGYRPRAGHNEVPVRQLRHIVYEGEFSRPLSVPAELEHRIACIIKPAYMPCLSIQHPHAAGAANGYVTNSSESIGPIEITHIEIKFEVPRGCRIPSFALSGEDACSGRIRLRNQ